jgi:endo-1,4-beta-mannosidase
VAGLDWPVQWQPAEIAADFAAMAELGFNTVRFDLFWSWFEPRPGDYNPEAFAQLDYLISLAHQYHIYLHPTLFVGGEVGEAYWDVPWRQGRDPQSDPDMLRLETDHAQELGRRYAREPAILAWDLTDEPPFWISSNTTDAAAVNWTRLISGGLRKFDKLHPLVVGVSTQDMEHGPFRPDTIAGDVDFFSVHPYTIYTPDLFPGPMVSERATYGAAFETTLSRDAGRPAMVQEMGASAAQYSPQKIVQFDRTNLYSALGAGANGFLLWCFTDAAPAQYRKVPYLRSAHETQFGLTTWDRKVTPQGASFRQFAKTVAKLDLEGIAPAHGDAAIVIPWEWSRMRDDFSHFGLSGAQPIPYVSVSDGGAVNGQAAKPYEGNQRVMSSALSAFLLTRRAGLKPAFVREMRDWPEFPVVMLPSPLTATEPVSVHVHTDFWEKVTDYVKHGGNVYASLAADSAIPEMKSLFGARMTDATPSSEVTLKVVRRLGDLKPGETFHFSVPEASARYWGTGLEVEGGEVIAVDQLNRPALVAHTLGQGRTLLSAYPLEAYLGNLPMVLEGERNVYRIYRALRIWAGVHPVVNTDEASVEASALVGKSHGYFVLTNHSAEARQVTVSTALPVRTLRQIGPDSVSPIKGRGAWTVQVPGYDGAVLEWTAE